MHVVLVEPEIPQNTGSIARTCAATGTPLHLVGALGFEISDRRVRRAGLDYWPFVRLFQHRGWDDFLKAVHPAELWFFSKRGQTPYHQVSYHTEAALVFGSETKGLGEEFLARQISDHILRIPMLSPHVRSLNLSNAVAIALYHALQQTGAI